MSYQTRPLTKAEVATAIDWAAAEGWNPGLSDAPAFLAQDAQGFWGGFMNGEMIASISVVNYTDTFAFLGFYIAHPDHRGRGFGYQLWNDAIGHAEGRVIGLDGVVAEQENYRRSGFELAYRNIRFGGDPVLPQSVSTQGVSRVSALDPDILKYDETVFPCHRIAFLRHWLGTKTHIALKATDSMGDVTGFGVLRPCRDGAKIGPLFADTPEIAAQLFANLVTEGRAAGLGGPVFLDTPEPNAPAPELARTFGLEPVFETARMYRGAAPDFDLMRNFGVTSFELG